jgi:hypothetical protein
MLSSTNSVQSRISSIRRASYALAAVALAGCAGASVAPESTAAPITNNRPNMVYVYYFAVNSQEVTLNQGFFQKAYENVTDTTVGPDQAQLASNTSQSLALQIVQQLESLGFNAVAIPRGTSATGNNVLVVDGEFQDINEGNRLRRTVIGLGIGASTMDVKVQVYQLVNGNAQQIMDFTTHANSGKMPGVAFTAPAGAAVGGAAAAASLGANLAMSGGKAYTSSMDYLTKDTSKQNGDYMSQYFGSQSWISQSIVSNAKINTAPSSSPLQADF